MKWEISFSHTPFIYTITTSVVRDLLSIAFFSYSTNAGRDLLSHVPFIYTTNAVRVLFSHAIIYTTNSIRDLSLVMSPLFTLLMQ